MCHTVTHDPRDAPPALGRPGRRRATARGRPGARRGRVRPATAAEPVVRRPAPRRRCPPDAPGGARRRGRRATTSLVDDDLRRLRTRGKSTPDLLRARAGDLDRRARRRRPAGRATTRSRPCSRVAVEHHVAVVPVRRRHLRHRRPGRPPRRVRRRGQPRPRPARPPGRRRPGLDDRDPRARPPRPRGRGAAGRARPDDRPLPAVLRARLDRRVRRDPVERPGVGGLRPLRRDGRRPHGGHARPARSTSAPSPANAAGPDLRQLVLGSEGAFGVITSVTVRVRPVAGREGLRGLALADLRRRASRPCARSPSPGCSRPCCGSPTRPSPRSTWPTRARSAAADGGLPDGRRLRGPGRPGRRAAGGRHRAAHRARRYARRRGAGPRVGARPLPGAVPARLDARPRRARRDARDRDLLVGVEDLYAGGEGRARGRARRRRRAPALVLCHVSHVYETGCSLYFTVAARQGDEPLEQWLRAKRAASEAIVAHGATITHHHAVGTDHLPWLEARDRPGRRADPAGGQGRARPDGGSQPRRPGPLGPALHAERMKVEPSSAAEVRRALRSAGPTPRRKALSHACPCLPPDVAAVPSDPEPPRGRPRQRVDRADAGRQHGCAGLRGLDVRHDATATSSTGAPRRGHPGLGAQRLRHDRPRPTAARPSTPSSPSRRSATTRRTPRET